MNYVSNPIWRDQVFSLGTYRDPVLQTLLRSWKYHGVGRARDALLRLVKRAVEDYGAVFPAIDAVSFVPLHARKRNMRGFDQAEVIAKSVAGALDRPFVPLLRRTRFTESQAQTDRDERDVADFLGAFVLADPVQAVPQKILLVDDVYTTGTTFRSAAVVLEGTGSIVSGLTIARG
jgi:predicted amidophosphoribosyltransferase